MPSDTVLICTVGGSDEPIVHALQKIQPRYTVFVCSEDDRASGQKGSSRMINGGKSSIDAWHEGTKVRRDSIPLQARLSEEEWEILLVPPDDLQVACNRLRGELRRLHDAFPDATIIADFTGGTKSMTGALIEAATDDFRVKLQVVTGARTDLVRIKSGAESLQETSIDSLRIERRMLPYLEAWGAFEYNQAAQGLAGLPLPTDVRLRNHLVRARDLSRGFAAWDLFEHVSAKRIFDDYAPVVGRVAPKLRDRLKELTNESDEVKRSRAGLLDLYRNMQRRARQNRYDDAVARLYRLLEWTAQWLLLRDCDLHTGRIPPEKVPEPLRESLIGDQDDFSTDPENLAIGLMKAWDLYAAMRPESHGAQFLHSQRAAMLEKLSLRNNSILGHGFAPIGYTEWNKFASWLESTLEPLLLEEVCKARSMPPQLPDEVAPFMQVETQLG